jgi:hypothetical protein
MNVLDYTTGRDFCAIHGDSCEVLAGLPENSIGLSVSSWPFSDQYTYSASYNDLGNNPDDVAFFAQLDYLLPELYRVTMPGRMAIIHAKDRIVYGTKNNGNFCINPFSDDCIRAMTRHGWLFYGRITVATDPVRENSQTHRLTHGELKKDSTKVGVGMPEYVLLFRKPPSDTSDLYADDPVTSCDSEDYPLARWQIDANSLWRSNGNRLVLPWEANGYDYHAHVAHLQGLDDQGVLGRANGQPLPTNNPWCWWNIQRINVLNSNIARANEDEKHICPLQLDLIERCIQRWSNRGDVVLDYFGGIGSVAYVALQMGRKGVGIELKREYHQAAVQFLQGLEFEQAQPTMFDLLEREEAA